VAANTALALQYPVGSSNEALRAAVVRLVDVLRTIQTDSTQQTLIDSLVTDLGDLTTTVENLELTGGTLTPQQEFELALDHLIDTVQGSRAEWMAYVETQMRRMADAILQVGRHQQDDAAAITVEQTVRVTENEVFAQQRDTISAYLAGAGATITDIETAVSNGDTALATRLSVVETTAGGNTTSISELTTSVSGISANWTIALNANDRVTGMVTLNGSENTSTFAVLADKFLIVHPAADGTTIQAFTTGLVNGVSTIGLTGAVIIDGTLLARHIGAGEITTAKLAAGAVTADKITVSSLSSLNADLGTVTAGLIRNAADTVRFDLPNMRLYRVDGKAQIDLANQIFEFIA